MILLEFSVLQMLWSITIRTTGYVVESYVTQLIASDPKLPHRAGVRELIPILGVKKNTSRGDEFFRMSKLSFRPGRFSGQFLRDIGAGVQLTECFGFLPIVPFVSVFRWHVLSRARPTLA